MITSAMCSATPPPSLLPPRRGITLALKRATTQGVLGIASTENVLSLDETPDIGTHRSSLSRSRLLATRN